MSTTKKTTPEENVAIMRRWISEAQAKGDLSLIDELVHPDFVDYTSKGPSKVGREGVKALMANLHGGLKDIEVEVVQCVGSDDIVATNKVVYGMHSGEFLGNPATGQRIRLGVMDFVKFEDGLMREHWATLAPVEPAEGGPGKPSAFVPAK